ncbi:hypothetical protein DJ56_3075 [Yersinia pestis]|nr:hypothetical protein DJ56_3075 [Yersinia pestis]
MFTVIDDEIIGWHDITSRSRGESENRLASVIGYTLQWLFMIRYVDCCQFCYRL